MEIESQGPRQGPRKGPRPGEGPNGTNNDAEIQRVSLSFFCRIVESSLFSLSLSSKPPLLLNVVQWYIYEERVGRVSTFLYNFTTFILSLNPSFSHIPYIRGERTSHSFTTFILWRPQRQLHRTVSLLPLSCLLIRLPVIWNDRREEGEKRQWVRGTIFKILYYVIVSWPHG